MHEEHKKTHGSLETRVADINSGLVARSKKYNDVQQFFSQSKYQKKENFTHSPFCETRIIISETGEQSAVYMRIDLVVRLVIHIFRLVETSSPASAYQRRTVVVFEEGCAFLRRLLILVILLLPLRWQRLPNESPAPHRSKKSVFLILGCPLRRVFPSTIHLKRLSIL